MNLPHFRWRGHIFGWQGHFKVWQRHFICDLVIPSPEICHGRKNDLTHQKNVFATRKNDLATKNAARSFVGVARSFESGAKTFLLSFIHTFARKLSWDKKWPNTPKKCICHTKKWPCHKKCGKVIFLCGKVILNGGKDTFLDLCRDLRPKPVMG